MNRFYLVMMMWLLLDVSALSVEPKAWKTFESPDGRYAISFPDDPKPVEDDNTSVIYSSYSCHVNEFKGPISVYYLRLPLLKKGETIEKFFDKTAAEMNSVELMSTVVVKKHFKWKDKYPAFEMKVAFKKREDSERVMYFYAVVTSKNIIAINLVGEKSLIQDKQIADCFDSLKIKE